MPQTRINSAVASDLTNSILDYSVAQITTDAATGQEETDWINDKWETQLGFYKTIPELRAVIDAKATWTIGKGIKADPDTIMKLDQIKGWGKDTFNTILENAIRVYYIGGDFFAEIIKDKKEDLLNLKPLDPSTIKIIVDKKGRIKRYEQISKNPDNKETVKFKKEQIFHLSRNRTADEIHGISMIDALEDIILMRNEAMSDWRRVLHRNVEPLWVFHLDTDDTTEIAAFKTKYDNARRNGENMYIPKDVVVPEQIAIAPNSSLNPLPWIESLNNYFYQAAGVPQIILGGSGEFTEASAKIAYLAFQQNIEEEQLFIEEQVGQQLGLLIELEFPASLENELLSDKKKDGAINIQPNETTAGRGQ